MSVFAQVNRCQQANRNRQNHGDNRHPDGPGDEWVKTELFFERLPGLAGKQIPDGGNFQDRSCSQPERNHDRDDQQDGDNGCPPGTNYRPNAPFVYGSSLYFNATFLSLQKVALQVVGYIRLH